MSDSEFTEQFAIKLPDGNLFLSPQSGAVVTWSELAGAEHVMDQLRDSAALMGIHTWTGEIVRRYCSPFIGLTDPGKHLVDQLTAWLKEQGGQS